MEPPADVSLPFLAYGIFRPGQISFFQLADSVSKFVDPVAVPGRLLVRDGLPIVELTSRGTVAIDGALLHFRPGMKTSLTSHLRHGTRCSIQVGDRNS